MNNHDKTNFESNIRFQNPKLLNIIRIIVYTLISFIFAYVWINLLVESAKFLGSFANQSHPILTWSALTIAGAFPIALLIMTVRKHNPLAYFIVVIIMFLTIIIEFIDLVYYYNIYTNRQEDEEGLLGLINLESICYICEIKSSIRIIIASTISIFILSSKFIGQRFQWKNDKHFKAVGIAIFIYGILRLIKYLQ